MINIIIILQYILIFFNDPATPEIYTLSLHDALPIYLLGLRHGDHAAHADSQAVRPRRADHRQAFRKPRQALDRKSTRLNSSHPSISYAVFCLKKKKTI